jgi:predicted GNAT family acetyltransferase
MKNLSPLDNPIWNALTGAHRSMARSNGRAARYASDVSPLTGLADASAEAFADMRELVGPTESVALFTAAPLVVPDEWETKRTRMMQQMVCAEGVDPPPADIAMLTLADIPDMLALTALAQPGPFLPRTIEMGNYFGIRASDGRLIAMAGERLKLDGFTEISAVCTHPDFRGRGYGGALVAYVAAQILSQHKTPFLHVVPENLAIKVYERVGLRIRRAMCLTIIAPRQSEHAE